MMTFRKAVGFKSIGLSTLLLGGTMTATAWSQTAATPSQGSSAPAASTSGAAINPDDSTTYATGKPLGPQSKEGFWGHMNPFARKKWVAREVDPIKDRDNELDQLQAKNANDIKDVDGRAQAGINKAMMAANTADAHAADAANKAGQAQSTANSASSKTDSLNGTVSNLDQYKPVNSTAVKFAAGHTILNAQAKSDLDDVATKLASEKGYIIEVEGFSKSGVQTSQAMADSVVRYLVTEHQVPLYRIYRTGLGKNTATPADGQEAIVNGVRVTLLHNSLADMNTQTAGMSSPATTAAN
jgi:outer membrane protein OmpA-like peptidoglycan-associated protein